MPLPSTIELSVKGDLMRYASAPQRSMASFMMSLRKALSSGELSGQDQCPMLHQS